MASPLSSGNIYIRYGRKIADTSILPQLFFTPDLKTTFSTNHFHQSSDHNPQTLRLLNGCLIVVFIVHVC